MGTAERREREREVIRTAIVEAARDILSEVGLDGLSMRAIADRIEYSPATIYLYFRDKDELVHEVVQEAFGAMMNYMRRAVADAGPQADGAEQFAAMGRAYAQFALENTAYFRVMFELPKVPHMDGCPEPDSPDGMDLATATVQRAIDAGLMEGADARRTAVFGWGLIHGLTSLYLTGRLADQVTTNEEFLKLVGDAMRSMGTGFNPVAREP